MTGNRTPRGGFHGSIAGDDLDAERRYARGSAAAAAQRRLNDRLMEHLIQGVDEQPGAAVRHPHRAGAGADRSVCPDGLQELDFAGPDP